MNRVILSSPILLEEGAFVCEVLPQSKVNQALLWLREGPVKNFCSHQTVKILGLDPATSREVCTSYDQALAIKAKGRLEFGREYTVEEIEEIGFEIFLITSL